jgi:predicted dehydrogenase
MKNEIARRTFLGGAAAAATLWSAKSYARIIGANDRVNVGLVGFSDRAKGALLPAFMGLSKTLNFDLVAISDIWSLRREAGVAFMNEKHGKTVAGVRNNEELYDRKDVDAVIVATADFQHAEHCEQGVKAGRDVFVEKPLANKMKDALSVLSVVEKSKQIVQIGTQRRSSPKYAAAAQLIKDGKFGNIVSVEMSWNVNQPGRWRRPDLVAKLRQEDTDWKRFLGRMPADKWDPRKYLEYRLFWPYSSGIPCQWMVHQIDTVHWFTGLPHPRSVVANGGIYQWRDGRKNFDTVTAVFDYGPADDLTKGFQVVYSSRMSNSAGETKEIYFSNGGTLDLDSGTIGPQGGLTEKAAKEMNMQANLLAASKLADTGEKAVTAANTGADNMTTAHMKNWMDCVRSRQKPNADIRAGYNHSVAVCMVKAALDTGKRVTFDSGKQRVLTS